jgi:hypothetical protein
MRDDFLLNIKSVSLICFLLYFLSSQAQQSDLSTAVRQFNSEAQRSQAWNYSSDLKNTNAQQPLQTGVKQYLEKFHDTQFLKKLSNKTANADSMLVIGATPGDSLIISGNWNCKVDILVFGDGKLRFKNAYATISGNIYVWGNNAEITADSSTLYIPQQYFYQRSIVAAGAGKVRFNHVTLDFSGLSHNMVAADSSTFDFTDVTKVGFTTNGLSGKAKYFINGTNLAGEFVIGDESELDFKKANTVLLWHEVPQNGTFHFSFPPAGIVPSYNFNPQLPGITNINYHIKLDSCTDVMWALMPADGSDVDITESKIRAIGLWFLADSVHVNGLVNNSDYNDFTALLSDRSLRLRNSTVQTWSLYSMHQSKISVKGCILGEIGSMGTSQVQTNSVFVDGSGGYMWANDTSFFVAFSTPITTNVRSERNGIMIFAYSPLNYGTATALGNSTLLAIQSSLPEQPVAYDNASVWNVSILQPSSGNSNSVIPIYGYALIDRTPTCVNPDMAWYQMFYSTPDNDSLIAITAKISIEKRNDTLAKWNTAGLKPGQYLLHIFASDSSSNPVIVEAVRSFSLNPGVLEVENQEISNVKVYPNPFSKTLFIDLPWANSVATVYNAKGIIVRKEDISKGITGIDVSDLPVGLYVLILSHDGWKVVSKFIKQ